MRDHDHLGLSPLRYRCRLAPPSTRVAADKWMMGESGTAALTHVMRLTVAWMRALTRCCRAGCSAENGTAGSCGHARRHLISASCFLARQGGVVVGRKPVYLTADHRRLRSIAAAAAVVVIGQTSVGVSVDGARRYASPAGAPSGGGSTEAQFGRMSMLDGVGAATGSSVDAAQPRDLSQ